MAKILSGWARSGEKEAGSGLAQIRQGIAAYQTMGGAAFGAYYLRLLAEAYDKAGQSEEGLATVGRALAEVQRTGGRYDEAELYRLKGQLALRRLSVASRPLPVTDPRPLTSDPQVEAEGDFLKAIETARGQGSKMLELRAVTSLSRVWQSQGKNTAARRMLAEICGWFTEGFETVDLREAEMLLGELK